MNFVDEVYNSLKTKSFERYSTQNILKDKKFAKFNTELCKLARGISVMMLSIFSLRMDIYMICRLFKKFKVKPNSIQPDEAYNSIIYAGNFHSTTYRNFLENNGFKLIASSIRPNDLRCVDIVNIPQPFFTGPPTPSSIS